MNRLYITVLVLLLCGAAFAQTDNGNKSLKERVSILENLSGYAQLGYDWDDAGTSSFGINKVNVTLAGNIYKGDYGKVDYGLQVSFAGSPKIMDAYVQYMPVQEFGVKLGQYKSPLGYENSMCSPVSLEFINYSLMTQRLIRMSDQDMTGLSTSGRDIGIEFLGSAVDMGGFNLLDYEVAVFNGYKLNSRDNNKSKDVVARLMVTPLKPLTFSGFFLRGEGAYPDFDDLTQTFTPQDADKYVKAYRYGGGVSCKGKSAFARAEFMGGKTGQTKSIGWYLAAGYTFAKDWAVAGRFDYFDADTDFSGIYELNYTAGIAYAPLKNLDVKLNYTYRQVTGSFNNKNCVYLQLTVKF